MNSVLYHPVTKRQEALARYIKGQTLPSIAEELGVPYGTVHHWHTGEKWASIRRQLRAELLENWKDQFRVRAAVELYRTLALHISAARELSRKIGLALKREDLTVDELATLAKALRNEFMAVEPLLKPILSASPAAATAA
jgi:hypothetical protein